MNNAETTDKAKSVLWNWQKMDRNDADFELPCECSMMDVGHCQFSRSVVNAKLIKMATEAFPGTLTLTSSVSALRFQVSFR